MTGTLGQLFGGSGNLAGDDRRLLGAFGQPRYNFGNGADNRIVKKISQSKYNDKAKKAADADLEGNRFDYAVIMSVGNADKNHADDFALGIHNRFICSLVPDADNLRFANILFTFFQYGINDIVRGLCTCRPSAGLVLHIGGDACIALKDGDVVAGCFADLINHDKIVVHWRFAFEQFVSPQRPFPGVFFVEHGFGHR